MRISGIYKIESRIKSERIYIGSAVNIGNRWNQHLHYLRHNNHQSTKLQRHFNKYGEADLIFTILLGCNKEDLIKIEQYFLDSYKPYFNNQMIANSQLGTKRSPKSRRKMSLSAIGNTNARGSKRGNPWNKGLRGIYSEKTLKQMSDKKLNKKLSVERCANLKISAKKGWETRKNKVV